MAAALTAITESFHFAHTHLDNWTLVTDGDGDGVMRLRIDLGTKTRTHQSAS